MSKLAEQHRDTMEKCETFDEWVRRFLKVEPSRKWKNAWNYVKGVESEAPSEP